MMATYGSRLGSLLGAVPTWIFGRNIYATGVAALSLPPGAQYHRVVMPYRREPSGKNRDCIKAARRQNVRRLSAARHRR